MYFNVYIQVIRLCFFSLNVLYERMKSYKSSSKFNVSWGKLPFRENLHPPAGISGVLPIMTDNSRTSYLIPAPLLAHWIPCPSYRSKDVIMILPFLFFVIRLSPLDWSIWSAYLWLLPLLYDKQNKTNTSNNNMYLFIYLCTYLFILLFCRKKPLEDITFTHCLFFQSLKLTFIWF